LFCASALKPKKVIKATKINFFITVILKLKLFYN
jgi:hypothetical protein